MTLVLSQGKLEHLACVVDMLASTLMAESKRALACQACCREICFLSSWLKFVLQFATEMQGARASVSKKHIISIKKYYSHQKEHIIRIKKNRKEEGREGGKDGRKEGRSAEATISDHHGNPRPASYPPIQVVLFPFLIRSLSTFPLRLH